MDRTSLNPCKEISNKSHQLEKDIKIEKNEHFNKKGQGNLEQYLIKDTVSPMY